MISAKSECKKMGGSGSGRGYQGGKDTTTEMLTLDVGGCNAMAC